jgi:hypothetical protein
VFNTPETFRVPSILPSGRSLNVNLGRPKFIVLSVIFATNFEGFPDMRGMSGFHRRERVPLDWARTQNNLGNAQALLNERLGESIQNS